MKLKLIHVGITGALILSAFVLSSDQLPIGTATPPEEGSERLDTERFISSSIVDRTLTQAEAEALKPCAKPIAGLVNHHDLAPELIAEFFVTLKSCRPEIKSFVLLSPDHYGQVSGAWLGPQDMGRALAREHGLGILVPFIERAFPSAQIAPFIIKQKVSSQELSGVKKYLEEAQTVSSSFILISADMSHYLDKQTALKNDELTLRALDSQNINFFLDADDDFTDSGKSIGILLQALRPRTWQLLNHQISTAYGGSPGYTTSYITGFWE